MFQGSIPADLRSIVAETVGRWRVPAIWVGASGNFTIERILMGGPPIHGNDVQLYSCAIGSYLAGHPLRVAIRDERRDEYGWLEPYLDSPSGALATLMLSTRMLLGWKRQTPYHHRIRKAYREQWPELHATAVERIERTPLRLASFFSGDVMEWVTAIPSDDGFVCFPPFFKNDYEAMYASLDAIYGWDAPTYSVYDPESSLRTLIDAARTKREWLIGTDRRQDDMEDVLIGTLQTTNRGVPVYVYGSGDVRRLVRPAQELAPAPWRRLAPGERVGPPIGLRTLTGPQFSALRSQYMDPRIHPGSPSLCLALVDAEERLLGAFAYGLGPTHASWHGRVPQPPAYLLSDFPVEPVDEPYLSKLIVLAAMSREAMRLGERFVNHRLRSVVTTARTERASSMKYRGPMRLLSKQPDPEFGWALNYGAPAGTWTLEEAYAGWRRRAST